MPEHVLALVHPHGAASTVGTGSFWVAIGVLIGFVTAAVAPGWLKGLVVVFDLVALGWMSGILGFADRSDGRWVWVLLGGIAVGLFLGVVRGLKYLSEWEFGTRLRNIRSDNKYF
jgi:hypothetical protein